jgi:hypothetical protein
MASENASARKPTRDTAQQINNQRTEQREIAKYEVLTMSGHGQAASGDSFLVGGTIGS